MDLAKALRFILRIVLVIALTGLLARLPIQHLAQPREAPSLGNSLVPDMPDRMQMLRVLRARSAAVAPGDARGTVYSGAASPGDILTAYLAAAGFMNCAPLCALTAKGSAQHWVTQPLIGRLTQITVPLAGVTVYAVSGSRNPLVRATDGQPGIEFSYRARPNALGRAMLAWAGSRHFCGIDYAARWQHAQLGTAAFIHRGGRWTLAAVTALNSGSNRFGVACAMP